MTTILSSGLAVLLLACLISFNLLGLSWEVWRQGQDSIEGCHYCIKNERQATVRMPWSIVWHRDGEACSWGSIVKKNKLLASNDKLAIFHSQCSISDEGNSRTTQEMMEMHDSRMFLASKEAIIKSESQLINDYHLSTVLTWLILSCKDVFRRFGNIDSFLTMMARNNSEEEIHKTSKVFDKDGLVSSQWLSCIIPMRKFRYILNWTVQVEEYL
jgi:hypothetical protein